MTKEIKGLLELILATFLFSLFGVFTRLISNTVGVFSQLMIRAFIMTILFYGFAWLTHKIKRVKKQDLGLLIFRGLFIIVDFSCFYFAVTNLSLGLTLFLFYASNIIVSFLFGALFLNEKMTAIKYISAALAIIGLFVMYKDSFVGIKMLPSFAALMSGICFGLTTTTSKKLTTKYNSIQVNLIGYFVAFILIIPVLLISKEAFTFNLPIVIWIELIAFALVGVGAFYLTLDGFSHVEAQKGSIVMLAELIFVMLLGYFLYLEIPSLPTIIGGLLIIFALLIPNISYKRIK